MTKMAILKMRELPAVQAAELRLLLYIREPHFTEHIIEKLCVDVFGISPQEAEFQAPDEYFSLSENHPERLRIDQLFWEYEEQFVTHENLTDDEIMEELLKIGVDFSDERGQPLRCTKGLGRVAEAAVKGVAGKLPDPGSAELEKFEDTLVRDRDAYMAGKKRRR